MSQIDIDAARAFEAGEEFRRGNTEVRVTTRRNSDGAIDSQKIDLVLHDSVTATCYIDHTDNKKVLKVTDAHWPTVTTKSRLNELPGVSVYQHKGVWHLNGKEWDGSWTKVKEER